jgi:restriction endonuclease Mrr
MFKQSHIPTDAELAEMLRLRLCWLSYDAFAMCMERLLRQTGFVSVQRSSRRSLKGPNSLSGIDLTAYVDTGVGLLQVAASLKRYKKPQVVPKHFVSELRGTIVERGIPHAIIISTVPFSQEAIDTAASYPGRPIWLLDGKSLGELMRECRIGTLEKTNLATGETYHVFDEESFQLLERYAKNATKAAA